MEDDVSRFRALALTIGAAAILLPAPAHAASAKEVSLTNGASGQCLTVAGTELKKDGAPVIQWPCNGSKSQRWYVVKDSEGGVNFRNAVSGKCIAIAHGTTQEGKRAIQWPCYSGKAPEQVWRIKASRIRNLATGRCLAIGEGSTTKGAIAIQWRCYRGNAPEQVWRIRKS
ncbi:RICIN domain-containing protein [Streptosporangium sandarakinum]|uniref:RICIN domain-containing protein n=1 Tax=Streptosporangium sandarakinum TaxID=1260955 RepID=UPI00341F9D98